MTQTQKIISSSNNLVLNQEPAATSVRWQKFTITPIKDAYHAQRNCVFGVAMAVKQAIANIAKTVANLGIAIGNKVYSLVSSQPKAAPVAEPATHSDNIEDVDFEFEFDDYYFESELPETQEAQGFSNTQKAAIGLATIAATGLVLRGAKALGDTYPTVGFLSTPYDYSFGIVDSRVVQPAWNQVSAAGNKVYGFVCVGQKPGFEDRTLAAADFDTDGNYLGTDADIISELNARGSFKLSADEIKGLNVSVAGQAVTIDAAEIVDGKYNGTDSAIKDTLNARTRVLTADEMKAGKVAVPRFETAVLDDYSFNAATGQYNGTNSQIRDLLAAEKRNLTATEMQNKGVNNVRSMDPNDVCGNAASSVKDAVCGLIPDALGIC